MQIFSIKAKLAISIQGVYMVLQRRLVDRRLLFFDELGEPTKLTDAEFYRGYEKRETFKKLSFRTARILR
jgi:putative transposase